MKLSDYIVPMTRYQYERSNIESEITDNLRGMFGISEELGYYITNTFRVIYDSYKNDGYRIIPMDITSDVNADRIKLSNAICNKFYRSGEIFKLFEEVDGKIRLADLSAYDDSSTEESSVSDYYSNASKEYGKTITKTDERNERTMGENAPIDSDIETISSPNVKGKLLTNNEFVDKHSGGDEEYDEGSSSNSNTITSTNKNPLIYEKYVEIISRTNIPHIIDEVLREFIWEFNEVR